MRSMYQGGGDYGCNGGGPKTVPSFDMTRETRERERERFRYACASIHDNSFVLYLSMRECDCNTITLD